MVFFLLAGVSSAAGGAEGHYEKGIEYASEGRFVQAREEFKEAIYIDPRHSPSKSALKAIEDAFAMKLRKEAVMHNFKGAALANKGMRDESITEFTKAIKIDSKYADAFSNRGDAYYEKGQYDRAISDFTKAIEIDPKHAMSYDNRGFVYMMILNEKTKACKDWKKACKLKKCRNYNFARTKGDCK